MEEIFFTANVSNKRFLREACGKKVSGEEAFIRHLEYLIVLTEIKIQSSVVAVKSS